jgi:hypothetical protein
VGGHCIGVDPYYLTYRAERAGYHPEVILAGRRINDEMGQQIARDAEDKRELVLRLASLLWRLRRATAIESGLFKLQARQLLQFRRPRQAREDRQRTIDTACRTAIAPDEGTQLKEHANSDAEGSASVSDDGQLTSRTDRAS